MRIDLERALSDIAATAQSAAAPVPVDRLVSRMHRRRAVRGAATGTVAVGAVAAVAVGATQLGRGTTPAEPAMTAVTEGPVNYWSSDGPCGLPAPTPTGDVAGLSLEASFEQAVLMALGEGPGYSNLDGAVTLMNGSEAPLASHASEVPKVVIAKDGVVALFVGSPILEQDMAIDVPAGTTADFATTYATAACSVGPDFTPMPAEPGEYQAYALWRLIDDVTGDQIELISEPMPIAIGPGLDADLTDAPTEVQAQAVLDQILQTAPIGDFPLCGGAVYDHGSQPLALSLDPAGGPFTGGQAFSGQTTISLTGDPVIANTSVPHLVITRDDVVVGFHTVDDSTMIPTDLAPGQGLPGTVQGPLSICATSDGQVFPLPSGRYQVYAVVEAFTFSARPAENPGNLIGAYSIVSNPVEITVD